MGKSYSTPAKGDISTTVELLRLRIERLFDIMIGEGGVSMSISDHQSSYVNEVLTRLDTAISDVAELGLTALPIDDLNRVVLRTCSLVSQAQGLQAAAIQEAENAGMSVRYGNRILTTHLAKETGQPTQTLGSARSLAVWLRDFPQLAEALTAGIMSRAHIDALRDVDNARTHQVLKRDQQLFIDAAAEFVWTDWNKVVTYWLNAADPDGELTNPENPSYGMRVRTKASGDVHVTILMDPVTGEAFLTMHDTELKRIETNERQALNEDPNTPVTSAPQKNLDALLRLMVRGWRREDGTYPDFLVNIVMSEHVAEDLLARTYGHTNPNGNNPLDIDPYELPIAWDNIDRRCETIRGTPVHPKHALGVLLAGKLRRIILNTDDVDHKILNQGKDVRFFNKTQRNALLVQQRGQCNLGTQTPFRWLQADHIKPTSKGGPTNLKNGQMINSAENKAKRDTWDPSSE